MICILCKSMIGNDEKNIIIEHNNEKYCRGCYDVLDLFNDNIKSNKNNLEKPNDKKVEKNIKNKTVCPKCKIPMDKNCSKCKLKNPLWR
jgi:hypothetical protein